jgi:hypothetical protein
LDRDLACDIEEPDPPLLSVPASTCGDNCCSRILGVSSIKDTEPNGNDLQRILRHHDEFIAANRYLLH